MLGTIPKGIQPRVRCQSGNYRQTAHALRKFSKSYVQDIPAGAELCASEDNYVGRLFPFSRASKTAAPENGEKDRETVEKLKSKRELQAIAAERMFNDCHSLTP